MINELNKKEIEKFSRQIILKNVGTLGQTKIKQAKVLIIGAGGLGCPVAEFLTRAGIGVIGVVDNDLVNLSNIHRQSLFNIKDLKKSKVKCVKKKLKEINPKTLVKIYNIRLNEKNAKKLIKDYDYIVDGSDNFETKFLINDFSLKLKNFLQWERLVSLMAIFLPIILIIIRHLVLDVFFKKIKFQMRS